MPNEPLLPIKVVIPDERRDYEKPEAGGGARKMFCSVTPGLREEIGHQIDTVTEYFAASFQRDPWRVVVEVQDRVNHFDLQPTPTAILVTIRDPKKQLPVYDEVVRQMATSGWVTQDIQVQDRVRMQFRA